MKLLTRLALSQLAPLGLIGAALLVTVGSVLRLTENVGELRADLETMHQEHELHRAAWMLDVALRQADEQCERGEDPNELTRHISERTTALDAVLKQATASRPSLRDAAEKYRNFAIKKQRTGLCRQVPGLAALREELKLDEELTDAWLLETQALQESMVTKEQEARRLSVRATQASVITSLLAALAVVLAARAIARSVTEPLHELATAAKHIGQGDFSREIAASGPSEVSALVIELDGMRQQLARLDQLKQSFLASISHELRTPLTKLREALALLEDGAAGPLTERQKRVVKIAQGACEREIRMVSTLLELSRLRAGTPLHVETGIVLERVIQAAIEYERDGAQERAVRVEVERRGELPVMSMDGALLERAVANLIRNAVSFSPKGEMVQVFLELRATNASGNTGPWVRVCVQDKGPGVSETLRAQLFTPFVSHGNPGGGRPAGVGLGLALSREIARAHGGDLTLDDSSLGASFSIWLPPNASPRNP